MKVATVMLSDPDTLDPGRADDDQKNSIVLEAQETLFRYIDGELTEAGCESYETSEDGLTWTFHLRDNKYSDGEEVKAQDYVNSIRRIFDPEVNCHNAGIFYCIAGGEAFNTGAGSKEDVGAVAVDDKTLEITLVEPIPYFAQLMTFSNVTPVPESKTEGEKNSSYGATAEELAQSGPFYVSEWTRGSKVVLKKNENYWDGEVPLDKVTLKCVDDQTTRSMALQTGEIDIAYNLKTENLIEFEGNDNYEIQELQSLRSTYAFMNQSEGRALSDKALRQALLRGLDKQTYCDVLLEGGATAGKAPVPPTLDFGFDDLNDENSYDPEGAKAILEEAGYKDTDGDGFVETPDGDPLTLDFVIYTSRAELGVYAQAAQASLKEIGINVNLNTVSYETLLDMRDSGQYDLLIWNVLVANTGDPENYLRENWYSKSANNTAGYNNPEVDELLDELAGTFDEEERKDLIIKIQQDIMDDAATVFFGYETTYLFSNKRVTGVKMYPMDYYWLTKDITLAE